MEAHFPAVSELRAEGGTYLNLASRSPLPASVAEVGIASLQRKVGEARKTSQEERNTTRNTRHFPPPPPTTTTTTRTRTRTTTAFLNLALASCSFVQVHPWKGMGSASEVALLRERYADLLGTSACNISIMPSTAYAMSFAARNIGAMGVVKAGERVLVLQDQMASNVYAWQATPTPPPPPHTHTTLTNPPTLCSSNNECDPSFPFVHLRDQ